jgi:hypothetical protein
MREAKLEATGVFIPIAVWENKDLSWLEKCLLAEIHACGGHRGACGATNETLAGTMGMTPGSVAVAISRFRKFELVKDVDGKCRRNLKTSWDGLVMAKDGLATAKNGLVMAKLHIDNKEDKISAPSGASSPESGKPPEESEHVKFFRLWTVAYSKKFGRGYKVLGGRDGKAIKNMLAEPGATAEMLMAVVNQAWAADPKKCFQCSKLVNAWQIESNWNFLNAELAASGVTAPRPEGIPSQAEVISLCKEKWGEDQRHTNWGASFWRHWTEREWKRRGLLIDWRVELSNQVNQWRKAEPE